MEKDQLLKDYYKESEEKMRIRYLDLMLLDSDDYLDLILLNIKKNNEIKNNAYALNVLSRKKIVQEYLKEKLHVSILRILLDSDDPKVRKNTYIMLGNVTNSGFENLLLEALNDEKIYYCLPSIILALGNYNIDDIEEILNEKKKELDSFYLSQQIEKAQYEEISNSIEKVILKSKEIIKHKFIGFNDKRDVLLTIMKALKNACFSDIKKKYKDARLINDGVLISTRDYLEIFKIRSFYEALLCGNENSSLTFDKLIITLINTLKGGFITSCHEGDYPFYYRIEIKSNMNKKNKLDIINKIKNTLDEKFKNQYINNPSSYEFEIRIIEDNGKYNLYFKLFTIEDKRYSYRVTDLPASINPTTAQILLQEIKGYLKNDSEVLDAFCGTSTMLIERSFISNYKSLTGIDINQKAIDCSKINANNVPLKIELVCEDILKYKGPEFDEVISNMPFGNRVSNHELNETLYKRFIGILDTLLKRNGLAFLLTSEISLMKRLVAQNNNLKMVKDIFVEASGLKPHLFIIKKVS